MKTLLPVLAVLLFSCAIVQAEDVRLQPLKDLNGYFPFHAPRSLSEWNSRREYVRRQILVAAGLWPMPTKVPLNAVIHGKIDRGEYTIEKVYFESAPGFFVTGNLYRPKNIQGKAPGVMVAHGHRQNARLYLTPEDTLRRSIADGAERFERGGRSTYQAQCRQLALMGCVVWLDDNGKAGLRNADGRVKPDVLKAVQRGAVVSPGRCPGLGERRAIGPEQDNEHSFDGEGFHHPVAPATTATARQP